MGSTPPGCDDSPTGSSTSETPTAKEVADQSWFYGDNGDHVFTGDFDGDGADSIGLFRPSNTTIYLRNSLSTGVADNQFQLGTPNSKPVAGKLN